MAGQSQKRETLKEQQKGETMPAFNVSRSIQIDVPQQKVFETVADFGTWTIWSPWLCAEPEAKVTVTDNPNSVGSIYSWDGEIVGAGEIEHQVLNNYDRIEEEIRFTKPWKSKSKVSFDLQTEDATTRLSWTMDGSLPWFMFWMKPMMQTMIGMDYDRGLKMLKEWLETGSIASKTEIRGIETIGPIRMAGVSNTCRVEDVGSEMDRTMSEAEQKLSEHNLPADEGISVYKAFDMKKGTFGYISGFMIPESAPEELSGLTTWSLPGSRALRVDHVGPYCHLGNGWSAANQYARSRKLKQAKGGAFEIYRTSPKTTEANDLQTEIYLPLK